MSDKFIVLVRKRDTFIQLRRLHGRVLQLDMKLVVNVILTPLILIIAPNDRLELGRYDRHLGLYIILRLKCGTGLVPI